MDFHGGILHRNRDRIRQDTTRRCCLPYRINRSRWVGIARQRLARYDTVHSLRGLHHKYRPTDTLSR